MLSTPMPPVHIDHPRRKTRTKAPFLLLLAGLLVGCLAAPLAAEATGGVVYHRGDEGPIAHSSGAVAICNASSHAYLFLKADGTVWDIGGLDSDEASQLFGLDGIISLGGGIALKADGTVWTWGSNDYGQIGDGTTDDAQVPKQVPGLANVAAIDQIGRLHHLALTTDGVVWSWGYNKYGQVGDGTTTDLASPVSVLSDVKAIYTSPGTGGWGQSYAIKTDGTVWAWGYGILGDGQTNTDSNTISPKNIPALTGAQEIYGHGPMTCILQADGTALGWGWALVTGKYNLTPKPVLFKSDGSQLANIVYLNSKSGVLLSDGTVWYWGKDTGYKAEQLEGLSDAMAIGANLTFAIIPEPLPLELEQSFVQVPEGGTNSLRVRLGAAPTTDVTVTVARTAGDSDLNVLSGSSLTFTPSDWNHWHTVVFSAAEDADTVSGTAVFSLISLDGKGEKLLSVAEIDNDAASASSTVWAWGNNENGQLGDGTTTSRTFPVAVLGGAAKVATSGGHTMALTEEGTVWTWGNNRHGQLGNGSLQTSLVPVQPTGDLTGLVDIACSSRNSYAVADVGTVWSWGGTPSAMPDISSINRVAAFGSFNKASLYGSTSYVSFLKQNGTVLDKSGDPVSGLTGVTQVAVGEGHYLALTSDGRVWTWGDNATGQLGDGTTTARDIPAPIPGLSGIVEIAAGGASGLAGGMSLAHSLALKSDGTLWVWGNNAAGQLGDGTKTKRLSPIQVPGLSNVTVIAGGGLHSAASLSDGSLWTWGNNQHGQLGDGSTIERLSPVQVPGLDGVSSIAASTSCTLVVAAGTASGGGPGTGQPGADCNKDGVINALDLQYVIDNFGKIVSTSPTEP